MSDPLAAALEHQLTLALVKLRLGLRWMLSSCKVKRLRTESRQTSDRRDNAVGSCSE